MKLGSCTQSGHGLALGGRHFKNNKTSKKKKSKENPPSTDLHYSKCHPEPHPFIFKMKITKTVNTKVVRSQLVYIQKMYKFIIFRLLPQTTAHLSLTKHNMPEPIIATGDNWPQLYKKQKNCPKLKSLIQLKLCHSHPTWNFHPKASEAH